MRLAAGYPYFSAYRLYRAGDTKETFSFDAEHIVSIRAKVLFNADLRFDESAFVDLSDYKDLIEALFSPAGKLTTASRNDTYVCGIELVNDQGGRKQLNVIWTGGGGASWFTIDQGRVVFTRAGDSYSLDRNRTQFVDEPVVLCSLIMSIANKDFDEEMTALAYLRIALGLQPPAKE